MNQTADAATPFADLDTYLDIGRVRGLELSPDGRRLVVGVELPDRERNRFRTALWEVDPDSDRPARRLTRGAEGESAAGFTPSGDLLFVSARPEQGEDSKPALWLLPAGGGEARLLAAPAGGVHGVRCARDNGRVLLGSAVMASAADLAQDAEIRAARTKAGVGAILHERFPVRHWDHDLGPDHTRLCTAEPDGDELDLRDLTGHAGPALHDDGSWDIGADGRVVVTTWMVGEPGGSARCTVVAIDVATGERRTLADHPAMDYESPLLSPDGGRVALVAVRRPSPEDPGDRTVCVVPVDGGEIRPLAPDWDRWPQPYRWTPDGAALIVGADDQGRAPLWRLDVETGARTRLTPDHGAYTDVHVSPDGQWVYALRLAIDSPPAPVRVPADGSGAVRPLPGPVAAPVLPGRLEEVTATAEDGTPLRAWLSLPHGASAQAPVPLLVQIHGGPVMSWNSWSWRWNSWLFVARGYAVLQPDPALSTGYGAEFVRRGWPAWGTAPFTDLMTITDTAQRRDDIDAGTSAALGASFGGYMANWVAGHTDRFDAIVSHASVWDLPQSIPTCDEAAMFAREMTREATEANSPHQAVGEIRTPMLIIHGDRDYRVSVTQALALWWDLSAQSDSADGTSPHKFLYFPDENHWILRPHNVKLWYETVLAFLAHHLRGAGWEPPELLGVSRG